MRIRVPTFAAAGVLALVAAVPAGAHVTVNPEEWAADDFARFDIRVPTQRDVDTTKVSVKLPEGVFFVSFQPKAGWHRTVKMVKLSKPVELFGDKVTERVDSVTWTGGRIRPGEFDEFGMSAKLPNTPGKSLVFPAVQTYASGEVVRWIGPPDSEEPAPAVKLTAAESEAGGSAPAAQQPQPPAGDEDGGGSDTLAIISLIVAIAALGAGVAALLLRRPRERVSA
jgi:periplasmic copper chaperone A